MDKSLPLFRINGTDRTVRATPEFAARFGGMTLVIEDAVDEPKTRAVKPRAKTAPKPNSSKEGK